VYFCHFLFIYSSVDRQQLKSTQKFLENKHMPIEIVPAGATAVVSERHEHSKHPDNWDLSTEMQRDLNHVRTQAEKEFIEVSNQAERNQAANVVQGALTDSKVQSSELNTQKGLDSGFRETMLRGDGHYERTQKQVSDFYSDSLLDSAKNAAAISVQSQAQTASLGVQATSNFNLASVQAQTIANLASVQAVQFANDADISRQKFAYEGQLQAQTIAAAAAAKAAECCCELKTAIIADGQKTRDLLNSITEQNLRDRASRAEASLSAYFAAKVAPVVP
jgi:hypothetical protein